MINTIKQIEALLSSSENQLDKIKNQYFEVVKSKSVDYNYNIEIKNFTENLRSILDYIAVAIYIKYGKGLRTKIYFPYADKITSEILFEKYFFKNYEKNNDTNNIYNIIKSFQYFTTKEEWLIDLMLINNKVKHNSLDVTKPEMKTSKKINSSTGTTFIQGNLQMYNDGQQLAISGNGAIYSGGHNVAVYANADNSFSIKFGNDSINIDKDNNINLNNVIITHTENNLITFINGKELISELNKMYKETNRVYNSLKEWIK